MFKLYILSGFRQIRSAMFASFLSVLGLSVGMAAFFTAVITIEYQVSFDKYNEKLSRIYIVTSELKSFASTDIHTPSGLAHILKTETPGIESVARWVKRRAVVDHKQSAKEIKACVFAEHELFDIMTFPVVSGDLTSFKRDNHHVVITESLSRRLFGNSDPIGEIVSIVCSADSSYLSVCAVIKDIPSTSTFECSAICPFSIGERVLEKEYGRSQSNVSLSRSPLDVITYVLLFPSASPKTVGSILENISAQNSEGVGSKLFHLFPLEDLYFDGSNLVNNSFPQGDLSFVKIAQIVALLLLFISCMNYLLLSIGRSTVRAKEVGIRRTFGASRFNLFVQFTTEATIVGALALLPSLVLIELFLEQATGALGRPIAPSYFHTLGFILFFLVVVLAIGLVGGGYASLYMSRQSPLLLLRDIESKGLRKPLSMRLLLFSQTTIFMSLTLASLIVQRQISYLLSGDQGFSTSNLLVVYLDKPSSGTDFMTIKTELQRLPGISRVSGASLIPATESWMETVIPSHDDPTVQIPVESMPVDPDFVETIGMELVAGESFRSEKSVQTEDLCILNETAVSALGLKDPVGQIVGGRRVIGVVKDFHMHSFHNKIRPLRINNRPRRISEVVVRLTQGARPDLQEAIKRQVAQFNGGTIPDCETFQSRLSSLYDSDTKFALVIVAAVGATVLLGCLGLFGLSLFDCRQKRKEIGIRKVLGANSGQIYFVLARRYIGITALSMVAATVIGYMLSNLWTRRFVYQITPGFWDFVSAWILDIVLVAIAVSYHFVSASLANPINEIRNE
ncbi:MAG: ABC transporter permease [Bacteroidota bacterium]